MKTRVRQMPNGKWLCEVKRWLWPSWRAAGFGTYPSGFSTKQGRDVMYFKPIKPADDHYPCLWHDTEADAKKVMLDVISFFNMSNN